MAIAVNAQVLCLHDMCGSLLHVNASDPGGCVPFSVVFSSPTDSCSSCCILQRENQRKPEIHFGCSLIFRRPTASFNRRTDEAKQPGLPTD